MVRHLHGRATTRKLLLLAAACRRRAWPLLADRRSRAAVAAAEACAEGAADPGPLAALRGDAGDAHAAAMAEAAAAERAAGAAGRGKYADPAYRAARRRAWAADAAWQFTV